MDEKNINQRLRELRKGQKLSQTQLADMLGVTPSYVSAMEIGKKDVTRKVVLRLIELFSVSADWLISGNSTNGKSENDPGIEPKLTPQAQLPPLKGPEIPPASPEADAYSTNKQVFVSYSHDDAPYVAALQRLLDVQQRQQAANIQQRLEKMLARLRKVQELIEELLGLPFDDKNFRALQHRIVRRPRFSDDDPFDKMSETAKTAHNEARERLLEQCEVEFDHHLNTLFMGISYGKIEDAEPRKGSAAEVLKDLLEKRRGEGGKWRALVAEEEAV